jgi:hypothetical protein
MYTKTKHSVPSGSHKAYFPITDCQFYKPYAVTVVFRYCKCIMQQLHPIMYVYITCLPHNFKIAALMLQGWCTINICAQQTFLGNWHKDSWRDTPEESLVRVLKVSLATQAMSHTVATVIQSVKLCWNATCELQIGTSIHVWYRFGN